MATRLRSIGMCHLCNHDFAKSGMTRHLESCRARKPGNEKRFHLIVEGAYLPMYWMHLEAKPSAKLLTLDDFLRERWLECCGHLSSFRIGDTDYESQKDPDPCGWSEAKTMNHALGKLLTPGLLFHYVYDFGTSTQLKLKVAALRDVPPSRDSIRLVAQNHLPDILCDRCGTTATAVVSEGFGGDDGWLCEKCSQDHPCGEEMLLPIVNSPRVGVCGYTGASW